MSPAVQSRRSFLPLVWKVLMTAAKWWAGEESWIGVVQTQFWPKFYATTTIYYSFLPVNGLCHIWSVTSWETPPLCCNAVEPRRWHKWVKVWIMSAVFFFLSEVVIHHDWHRSVLWDDVIWPIAFQAQCKVVQVTSGYFSQYGKLSLLIICSHTLNTW